MRRSIEQLADPALLAEGPLQKVCRDTRKTKRVHKGWKNREVAHFSRRGRHIASGNGFAYQRKSFSVRICAAFLAEPFKADLGEFHRVASRGRQSEGPRGISVGLGSVATRSAPVRLLPRHRQGEVWPHDHFIAAMIGEHTETCPHRFAGELQRDIRRQDIGRVYRFGARCLENAACCSGESLVRHFWASVILRIASTISARGTSN